MKFLKFILKLAVRTVEVVLGLLLLLFLLSWLVALPGRIRFHRYCSYGSLREMRAAESDVSKRDVSAWRWNPRWNFPSNYSSTEVKLRKMRMPETFPAALATMGELAAFLQQATIDYGAPELPKGKRIVKFVCSDAAAKKVFPERPKPTEPLIESLSGADVSIWDALLKCCRDTGCVAEIRVEGVVTIKVRPPAEK